MKPPLGSSRCSVYMEIDFSLFSRDVLDQTIISKDCNSNGGGLAVYHGTADLVLLQVEFEEPMHLSLKYWS